MEIKDYLMPSIIGFLIFLVITFHIIRGAVMSAIRAVAVSDNAKEKKHLDNLLESNKITKDEYDKRILNISAIKVYKI